MKPNTQLPHLLPSLSAEASAQSDETPLLSGRSDSPVPGPLYPTPVTLHQDSSSPLLNAHTMYQSADSPYTVAERDAGLHPGALPATNDTAQVLLPVACAGPGVPLLSGQSLGISGAEEADRGREATAALHRSFLQAGSMQVAPRVGEVVAKPAEDDDGIFTVGAGISVEGPGLHAGIIDEDYDMEDADDAASDEVEAYRAPPSSGVWFRVHGFLTLTIGCILTVVASSVRAFLSPVLVIIKYPVMSFVAASAIFIFIRQSADVASEAPAGFCVMAHNQSYCLSYTAAQETTPQASGVPDSVVGTPGVDQRDHSNVDFPTIMSMQSHALDQLLARSAAGSELALSVKHAELAVEDLVSIVKASKLSQKGALTGALQEFASNAKTVGRHLNHLSAKLDGAVDTILTFDDYVLRVPATPQSASEMQGARARMLRSAMHLLASEVANVLADASTVAAALDALEEKLSGIHSLIEYEYALTRLGIEDLHAALWTKLGGNGARRQQLAYRVEVLDDITTYRRRAVAHVSATLQILLLLEAELSEIHHKLVFPSAAATVLPVDVQITSIEQGIRRLREERLQRRGKQVGSLVVMENMFADGSVERNRDA